VSSRLRVWAIRPIAGALVAAIDASAVATRDIATDTDEIARRGHEVGVVGTIDAVILKILVLARIPHELVAAAGVVGDGKGLRYAGLEVVDRLAAVGRRATIGLHEIRLTHRASVRHNVFIGLQLRNSERHPRIGGPIHHGISFHPQTNGSPGVTLFINCLCFPGAPQLGEIGASVLTESAARAGWGVCSCNL